VENGEFPQPKEIGGSALRWDRLELDAAWDAKEDRKGRAARGSVTFDDLMAERDGAPPSRKSMGDRFIETIEKKRGRRTPNRRRPGQKDAP
jgi:hypothetical protein